MTEPVQALKPCPTPWCQSSDEIELTGYRGVDMFVVCGGCGVQGPGGIRTEAKAITAWNTRPIETNSRTGDTVGEAAKALCEAVDRFNGVYSGAGLAGRMQGEMMSARWTMLRAMAQSITPPEVGGELVGKLKDLADYYEPNDVIASTLIRRAIAALSTPEVVDGNQVVRASAQEGTALSSQATEPQASPPCGLQSTDAWQPIDTAPRDGTDILVSVTHNLSADEWETKCWVDWAMPDILWPHYRERIDIPFPPTHWMPLPEAPRP